MNLTPEQRKTIVRQIGTGNVLAISGGRVKGLVDGIELPVSSGYRVRVTLDANDTYTVARVMVRGAKEFPKGSKSNVYCEELGETAYRASCYKSYDESEW